MARTTTIILVASAAASQAVTSSTTVVNDTELIMPLDANKAYVFGFYVPFSLASASSGYKFGVTFPASPSSLQVTSEVKNIPAQTLAKIQMDTSPPTVAGALATTGNHLYLAEGVVRVGVTSGNLRLQFAQNVSDAGAITLLTNRYVLVVEI